MSFDPTALPNLHPETQALHAGQKPDPATNARARPDLRHDLVRVRRRRPRRAPVRAPGVRQHLHPDHEPDQRRVRAAGRRARGRRGALALASGQAAETLAILNLASAGDNIVSSSSLYGGTYNLFHYTLPKLGITVKFVDGLDPASFGPAIDERTKAVFFETIGNPRLDVARHPGDRRRRARQGRAGPHRQHVRPAADQADRARRRHRHPLGHQVDRRPRHVDRRHRRRQRQLRLGGLGPVPGVHRPGSVVPRCRLQRGVRQPRLHPQAARAVAARRRRGAQPVQRLPVPPGPRDAPAADRAPQPERAGDRPLARGPARGRLGQLPGPPVASGPRGRGASTSRAATAAS